MFELYNLYQKLYNTFLMKVTHLCAEIIQIIDK